MTSALSSAWSTLCHHCDGIALGTTLETLYEAGVLERLRQTPMSAQEMSRHFGLSSGFAALAGKLLQSQALVEYGGGIFHLSGTGKDALEHPRSFLGMRARIGQATALLEALIAGGGNEPAGGIDLAFLKDGGLSERWRQQALGPLAAVAWFGLDRRGILQKFKDDPYRPADAAEKAALKIQEAVGWIAFDANGNAHVTETGRAALNFAVQYAYPICYLPTFASVPALLHTGKQLPRVNGEETHVDRSLDIAFSGAVFSKTCRDPFFDMALPLFDGAAGEQPVAIVDTGSGDGTVLRSLFEAVRTRTQRGQVLDRHPLVLVGVEVNEVARRATEERLSELGVPVRAILGDIGDPRHIAVALTALEIDPMRVLHVNKSVIHNRTFLVPEYRYAAPETKAVFTRPGGDLIAPDLLFSNLVEFFADWKPFLGRHGMISIEAHTVAPERAASRIGGNLITLLDAAHGYSTQYLVEIDVHRKAQDLAGIRRLAQHDIGAAMVGAPIMSIDHLHHG
ncbi:AprA-related methyltransferase [Microvirga rosea]|uniref:AprA-related methyltransferase n=1 Tax=Microvirga rosea TaxID=2715425 RepID=UPI001D0B2552|nr:hypothetical protein [Microvirga rosea]MCB8822129.1 hypothetical protein [Microvirga rosea]